MYVYNYYKQNNIIMQKPWSVILNMCSLRIKELEMVSFLFSLNEEKDIIIIIIIIIIRTECMVFRLKLYIYTVQKTYLFNAGIIIGLIVNV